VPPPLRVPLALRLLLLTGLVLLLFFHGSRGRGEGTPVSLEVVDAESAERLLAMDPPPAVVRRTSTAPPDPGELLRIRALSPAVPLEISLPGYPPPLRLDPPRWARAERAGALRAALHGTPGGVVQLVVEGDAGVQDTLEVILDSEGAAEVVLPFRPVRDGWHQWRAIAGGDTAQGGVLVAPPRPIRVLALAGGAGWEARFVVRALEESGVPVTLRQPLGGGRWVVGSATEGMLPLPSLEELDVLLLLPGGEVPGALATGLLEWVAGGGGVVAVAAEGEPVALPGLLPLGVWGREQEVSASALEWTLPPELVPLPPLALEVPVLSLAGLDPPTWMAGAVAPGGDAPLLAFRGVGSGRLAVAGLPATWLWRMEGGALAEHRTFWRRMMEWGAGGGDRRVWVMPSGEEVPGAVVRLPVEWTGPGPPPLRLRHPDGTEDPLEVAVLSPGRGTAAFVPGAEGLHVILDASGEGIAAIPVSGSARPAPGAFPAAVRLAGASGGGVAPGGGAVGGEAGDPLPRGAPDGATALLLLGLLALPALGEWTLRRLRGIP
jgi:hypothetical protein